MVACSTDCSGKSVLFLTVRGDILLFLEVVFFKESGDGCNVDIQRTDLVTEIDSGTTGFTFGGST